MRKIVWCKFYVTDGRELQGGCNALKERRANLPHRRRGARWTRRPWTSSSFSTGTSAAGCAQPPAPALRASPPREKPCALLYHSRAFLAHRVPRNGAGGYGQVPSRAPGLALRHIARGARLPAALDADGVRRLRANRCDLLSTASNVNIIRLAALDFGAAAPHSAQLALLAQAGKQGAPMELRDPNARGGEDRERTACGRPHHTTCASPPPALAMAHRGSSPAKRIEDGHPV